MRLPDLKIGSGQKAKKFMLDLIPVALMIERYLADDQEALREAEAELARAEQELDEFIEEHGASEGALDGIDGKGGVPGKANVITQVMRYREELLKSLEPQTPAYKAADRSERAARTSLGKRIGSRA